MRIGKLNYRGRKDHPIPVIVSNYLNESGKYVNQLNYDWISINRMIPKEVEKVSLYGLEKNLGIGLKLIDFDTIFKNIVHKSEKTQTDQDKIKWSGVKMAFDPLTLITDNELTPEQFSDAISQVTEGRLVLNVPEKPETLREKIASSLK